MGDGTHLFGKVLAAQGVVPYEAIHQLTQITFVQALVAVVGEGGLMMLDNTRHNVQNKQRANTLRVQAREPVRTITMKRRARPLLVRASCLMLRMIWSESGMHSSKCCACACAIRRRRGEE